MKVKFFLIEYNILDQMAMKLICVDDYEKEAFKKLPKDALDYYRSGADEEQTLQANRDAFKRWKILPRFLRDVSSIDMSLTVFGDRISCPIGASPTAMHKVSIMFKVHRRIQVDDSNLATLARKL